MIKIGKSLIENWIDNASKKYKLDRESKKLIKKILKHNTQKIVQQIEQKAQETNYKNHYIGPHLTHQICEKNLKLPNEYQLRGETKNLFPKHPEVN